MLVHFKDARGSPGSAHATFQTWREHNPDGYVLHVQPPRGLLTHRTDCRHFGDTQWQCDKDGSHSLTKREKVGSLTHQELIDFALSEYSRTPSPCADCRPQESNGVGWIKKPDPQYWLIKGRSSENDWDDMLRPGTKSRWRSLRPPKDWAFGDRIFCWEAAPGVRVVGLAQLGNPDCGEDEEGNSLFEVEYLTRPLDSRPGISELRTFPILNEASFLKSGPAGTVFPITAEQAELLMRVLVARNPSLQTLWPDLALSAANVLVPDLEIEELAVEGGQKWIAHFIRERSRTVIEEKKAAVFESTAKLACEVCDFDFAARFGALGDYFCEVHHLLPLGERDSSVVTQLGDLAIVCPNCHRMLHRAKPALSIQALRSVVLAEG